MWRPFSRGIRALVRRSQTDRELADEVQAYLDEAAAEHQARGLSPEQARRAARVELGSAASVREQMGADGWERIVEGIVADVRGAVKRLRAAPGFAGIVVLTLALGIGAATAIFSAARPVLFEPLTYPDARRLVMIWETQPDGRRVDGTFGMFQWLTNRSRTLESIAAMRVWQPTITGAGDAERLTGQRVSASYFKVLGVPPATGRDFAPTDDRPEDPRVVIISDALWRSRFSADPTAVGRQIVLDDASYTVIGIMPTRFDNVLTPSADVWAPLQFAMSQGRAWGHQLRTVGRLGRAATPVDAAREIDALGQAALNELRPATYGREVRFAVTPLAHEVTRAIRPTLVVIIGAVSLLLMIASVNVANLIVGRDADRMPEFALRSALGAGRGRLVRQQLAESLVLATAGGIVGMAVAGAGVQALVQLSPDGLTRTSAIGVDATALAFGILITAVVGVAVGILPAIRASRTDAAFSLPRASKRLTGGHRRVRNSLVIAEVALALTLLVGSGLLVRSLHQLFAAPLGFDPKELLTLQVQATGARVSSPQASNAFFDEAEDALRRLAGVRGVAVTSQLPMNAEPDEYGVTFQSAPGSGYSSFRYAVSDAYFDVMRIPIRRGRVFDGNDRAGTPLVAVVSESLARAFGRPPIGERLQIGGASGFTVVGIVGDIKQRSLVVSDADAVYVPSSQWPFDDRNRSFVIRSAVAPMSAVADAREAIRSVDPDQPIVKVATMDALVASTEADRLFVSLLLQMFALAALVLAAGGLYSVLASAVAERRHEMGVRAALGASRSEIVGLVVWQGLVLTGTGAIIGLVGAAMLSRVLSTLLIGISPLDPLTYIAVSGIVAVVTLLASAVPAWRAVRIDPTHALRGA